MSEPDTARLLTRCTAWPRVEHRTFVLRDPQAVGSPLDAPAPRGRVCVPGPGGVVLSTGGNDFYPEVTLEAWSAEPPVPAEPWEVTEETGFTAPSGSVQVRDLQNAPSGQEAELGAPGAYRVRACSRGRAEAEALVGHELYYEGVEEWLLQVWPEPGDDAVPGGPY